MAVRDSRPRRERAHIAELAARYLAEHGIQDYALAKRKAARQLGLPEGQGLPSNEEVDAALMQRRELYAPEAETGMLAALRAQALAVMRVFRRFEPVLSGAVASGAVSAHSLIELDIAADHSKDFEQFLLNQGIAFKVQDQGGRQAFLVYAEPADVRVRLLPADKRTSPGGGRIRLSLDRLERLLAGEAPP